MNLIDDPCSFDSWDIAGKTVLVEWIRCNLKPQKNISSFIHTGMFRELVRLPSGEKLYVPNGVMKGALLYCGYKLENPNGKTSRINVSPKSPIFKEVVGKVRNHLAFL